MTNTSIADDLIYGQSNIQEEVQEQQEYEKNEKVNNRVESTKTKFYVVLFLGLGLLLLYKFLLPAYDKNEASEASLQKVQAEVDAFQEKKRIAVENLTLIKMMENQEQEIIDCVNDDEGCEVFTGKNMEEIKDFLNLTTLAHTKMVINEKKILANLNEFLLKKNSDGEYNGAIESIHIGKESAFDKKIFYSPLDLKIAFDNKDDLLSFVDNIEKKILSQAEYRILYQIENIKYDILKSQEKQSVDISMYMFYTR